MLVLCKMMMLLLIELCDRAEQGMRGHGGSLLTPMMAMFLNSVDILRVVV